MRVGAQMTLLREESWGDSSGLSLSVDDRVALDLLLSSWLMYWLFGNARRKGRLCIVHAYGINDKHTANPSKESTFDYCYFDILENS